jgi:hypothetical protein
MNQTRGGRGIAIKASRKPSFCHLIKSLLQGLSAFLSTYKKLVCREGVFNTSARDRGEFTDVIWGIKLRASNGHLENNDSHHRR